MSEPIKHDDIRKGDRVRRISEFTAVNDFTCASAFAEDTYELIERPVTLPDVPGYYLDRNCVLWNLEDGNWILRHTVEPAAHVAKFAPFTLLRPVAEVAAEVLGDVRAECLRTFPLYMDDETKHDRALSRAEAKWVTK